MIATTIEKSERERVESIAKRQRELKTKLEAEFNEYKANKKKVKCIHKPTDLLQKTGPYKPLRDILLYYFKCEEGLRALLSLPKKQATKPVRIKIYEEGERLRVELVTDQKETTKPPDYENPVKVLIEDNIADGSLLVQLLSDNISMDELQAKLEEATRRKYERPVKIHIQDNRSLRVELLSENMAMNDMQTELQRLLPVKVRIQERSVKVDVIAENLSLDDIVGTIETNAATKTLHQQQQVRNEKKSHVQGPVQVKFREAGSALKLELVPNPNYTYPAEPIRRKVFEKEDWIAREEDYARIKAFEKEDWVPREDEGFPARWEATESLFKKSSTKVVWSPNGRYLEARDATTTSLQTTSMKLLKRLRPHVDRPQFSVSPEVVNFRKVKLGATAMQIVTLSNYQSDFSRFKIHSRDDCLKVVYNHGPLASGMTRRLKVYLKGSTRGQFSGKVHIETEFDIFIVPVLAEVLQM